MALVWCDGFDAYGDAFNTAPQPTGIMAARYQSVSNESQIDVESAGPVSGNFIQIGGSSYAMHIGTPDLTTNATLIAGVRAYLTGYTAYSADNDWPLLTLKYNTGYNVKLMLTNGCLWVADGNNKWLGSFRSHLKGARWYYFELKSYCHSSSGTVEARINGCPVISLTSVNTDIQGGGYHNRASIGDATQSGSNRLFSFDDWYVCDGSGNTNNDFLGPITVHTVFPDADDSVNFATTGNANFANHYQQVNDNDAMWTTDYIEDSTTGNRDIFTLANTVNFSTIYGVVGNITAEGRTSNQNYHQVFSSNGTEYESGNISANTSVNKTSVVVVETDPDTSNAWTPATVNALKFGIELQ